MKITVKYFATLAESAGCEQEQHIVDSCTAEELYKKCAQSHAFTLSQEHIKVAINHEYAHFSDMLSDGDVVVFIPPVSGG